MCDLIPSLTLKTKVSLVIHKRELKRTSNTGTLALKALVNSEMRVRGLENNGNLKHQALDLTDLLTDTYENILLYPTDKAVNLTPEVLQNISKPIQFIVPDGNWRQASKVHIRHKELDKIKHVKIKTINLDKDFLRKETTENGMATLQAIAYALGVTEGLEIEKALLGLYSEKLKRTLLSRGTLKTNP